MLPDLLHLVLPIQELSRYFLFQHFGSDLHVQPRFAEVRRIPAAYLVSNRLAAATAGTMGGIWLLSICL